MRNPYPILNFHGPFRGLVTDVHPRNLLLSQAADCDNVVCPDGHVTQRPGLSESCGGGTVSNAKLKTVAYVGSITDYAVATGMDGEAFVQSYDEDQQQWKWAKATLTPPVIRWLPGWARYNKDSYFPSDTGPYVYRNGLDNLRLIAAGMEAFDLKQLASPTSDNCLMADATSGSGISGTVRFWVSRYNAKFDIESNAVQCKTSGGAETLAMTDNEVTVTVTDVRGTLRGVATHVRIYQSRADGRGFPGLIAEIPLSEGATTFAYNVGVSSEDNGGATYDMAVDTTNYLYGPPSQNSLPPSNTTAMAYFQERMFYGTDRGLVYYSQSADELQGHVESVSATSFFALPLNEKVVAMKVYKDALYIFTNRQIHRHTGLVNSLTNAQVVQGTLADEIVDTGFTEDVEGTVGCVSVDSVIEAETAGGSYLFFAGPAHFYQFNGDNATPITENVIQSTYKALFDAVGTNGISAAHYKELNLIVFAFKDSDMLSYDYMRREWTRWAALEDASGTLTVKGPVTTRSLHHGYRSDEPLVFRQDSFASSVLHRSFVMDSTIVTDDDVNLTAYWIGPNTDAGAPTVAKRWSYMHAYLSDESGGTMTIKTFRNGDSSAQVPATPKSFDQNKFNDVYDPIERLGYRSMSVQPRFDFSGGSRTKLIGYALGGTKASRR